MKQTSLMRIGLMALVLLVALMIGAGQADAAYELKAWVMGSAGSSSFTVGEPVVGRSTGGGYENCAGFWCVARGIDNAFSAWVTFAPGLNLFGMPVTTPAVYNASDLLGDVLVGGEIGEAHRYNGAIYEVGLPGGGGTNFDISDAEGYLLYMQSGKNVKFVGPQTCPQPSLNLTAGLNVVSIACPSPGLSAYDIAAGLSGSMASLMKFDTASGTFQTVSFDGLNVVGPDFEIKRGEAYLLNMNSGPINFTP